jgi:hypothetical protein
MLTEEQIERRVERMVDYLDRLFMSGALSDHDYNAAMRDLNRWADAKYAEGERK